MRTTSLLLAIGLVLSGAARAAAPAADPVAADPAAAWTRFLATATYQEANDAYRALGEVHYDVRSVGADGCRSHAAELDVAVAKAPVALALRHAAMLCAESRGDTAAADRHMQALAALSRHALAAPGTGAWTEPVRVLRPEDIEALLAASGYEQRYAYYDALNAERHLPLVVVAWDAEAGVERHFTFDWIDALARLRSDRDFAGYPFDRYLIARSFLESWAGDGDVAAVDLEAVRAAWLEDAPQAKRDRLQAGAGRGGVLSAQTWQQLCQTRAFAGCADGLVDALLPLAEKGHALPRVLLAASYLAGTGIERDEAAARRLFDSADRVWGGHGAPVHLAALLVARQQQLPAWLEQALGASAASGNSEARALLVARRLDGLAKGAAVAADDRAFLEAPANNRRGRGYALLAAPYEAAGHAEAAALRAKAAAAGHAGAQRGEALDRLAKSPKDAAALRALEAAAHSGDAIAGRRLAYQAVLEGRWKAAEGWLLYPVVTGDVDAQLMLAGVYEEGVEGVHGGPKEALQTYEILADEAPAARRRFLALLVDGPEAVRDPARARRILEEAAAKDDAESQMMLAGALVRGRLGAADVEGGRRWYEKAIAAGSHEARSDYAMWLYAAERSVAARARAVALLQEADRGGLRVATNNLAWMRCVSTFDDVRDARAGLEAARRLGEPAELDPGLVDTVAACHAAAGDFDAAARLQAQAIDELPPTESAKATLERMRARLELYRRRQPYRETPTLE